MFLKKLLAGVELSGAPKILVPLSVCNLSMKDIIGRKHLYECLYFFSHIIIFDVLSSSFLIRGLFRVSSQIGFSISFWHYDIIFLPSVTAVHIPFNSTFGVTKELFRNSGNYMKQKYIFYLLYTS